MEPCPTPGEAESSIPLFTAATQVDATVALSADSPEMKFPRHGLKSQTKKLASLCAVVCIVALVPCYFSHVRQPASRPPVTDGFLMKIETVTGPKKKGGGIFGLFDRVSHFASTGLDCVTGALDWAEGAVDAVDRSMDLPGKLWQSAGKVMTGLGATCGTVLGLVAPMALPAEVGICGSIGVAGSMIQGDGADGDGSSTEIATGAQSGVRRLQANISRYSAATKQYIDQLGKQVGERFDELGEHVDKRFDELDERIAKSTKAILEEIRDVKHVMMKQADALHQDINDIRSILHEIQDDMFKQELRRATDEAFTIVKEYKLVLGRLMMNSSHVSRATIVIHEEADLSRMETMFDASRLKRMVLKHVKLGHSWSEVQRSTLVYMAARVYTYFFRVLYCKSNGLASEIPAHSETLQADLAEYKHFMYDWCPHWHPCPNAVDKLARGCFAKNSTSPCWAYLPGNAKNLTGNLSQFPRSVDFINLTNSTKIIGDLKDIPVVAAYIDLRSSPHIRGDVSDIPKRAYHIDLRAAKHVSGHVRSFARTVQYMDLTAAHAINGTADELPCNVNYLALKPVLEQSGRVCANLCTTYTCPPTMQKRHGTYAGSHWDQCCQTAPKWMLASKYGQSCTSACAATGAVCEDGSWPKSRSEFEEILAQMGESCDRITSGGWDGNPCIEDDGHCYWEGGGDDYCDETDSDYKRFCRCRSA